MGARWKRRTLLHFSPIFLGVKVIPWEAEEPTSRPPSARLGTSLPFQYSNLASRSQVWHYLFLAESRRRYKGPGGREVRESIMHVLFPVV